MFHKDSIVEINNFAIKLIGSMDINVFCGMAMTITMNLSNTHIVKFDDLYLNLSDDDAAKKSYQMQICHFLQSCKKSITGHFHDYHH